jgi:hypothetical protein
MTRNPSPWSGERRPRRRGPDGSWIKDPIFKLGIEKELLAKVRLEAARSGDSISKWIEGAILDRIARRKAQGKRPAATIPGPRAPGRRA